MKHAMRVLASIIAITALSGCSATSGLQPDISQSGFDGARVVSIQGHGNACSKMVCTGLGAQWKSSSPSVATLVVYTFNDISAITGAKLNVDGKIYELVAIDVLTNFNEPSAAIKESRKGFLVSLELIRKITKSQKTWLRVQTHDGYIEDAVIDGGTESKAYNALKRFLLAVDQA